MASNCVCCFWIDWSPFSILLNINILDPSLAFNCNEETLVILLYRRWNRCIDCELKTRYLQEATAFSNSLSVLSCNSLCICNTVLESIEDFSACCIARAEVVAIWMDTDHVSSCDVTLLDCCTDTTAVHKCDICISNSSVSICTEVTDCCFSVSNSSDTVLICDREFNSCVSDYCVYEGFIFTFEAFDKCCYFSILLCLTYEFSLDGTIFADSKLSDVVELCSCLCVDNLLSTLISNEFAWSCCVRVTIDDCIDTCCVGNKVCSSVWLTSFFNTKVRDDDDNVCTLFSHFVYYALDCLIKIFTSCEIINEFITFHEVSRSRLCN